MREIKFRAWYANQEMHYGIAPINNEYYIFFETQKRNAHDLQINRAISIMQYTGLKDKNGKEIYEGDIVETVTSSGNPFGTIDVVRWQDGGFKLVDETNSLLPIYIGDKEVISIEVIGNIYENSKLLEGEKHD